MSTAVNQFTGELDILGLGTGAGNDLQAVTDNGATTTNPVTITSATSPALTVSVPINANTRIQDFQVSEITLFYAGTALGLPGMIGVGDFFFAASTSALHYILLSDSIFAANIYQSSSLHSFTGSRVQSDTGFTTANGSVGTPSFNFSNDTTSGFYLVSAGSIGLSITGALEITFTTDRLTFNNGATTTALAWNVNGELDFIVGSSAEILLAANAMTFVNGATRTGIGWATNGQLDLTVNNTAIQSLTASTFFFRDATNWVGSTGTGHKIGTATSQKFGFFNATPIIQPGATTDLGTVLSNLGLRAAGTAYPITTSGAVNFTGGLTLTTVGLTITDVNIVLGTTTGTKFGTDPAQKLSFFNSTPIVQPANTTALDTAIINLGLLASGGAYNIDNPGVANYVFNPSAMAYFYDDFTGNSTSAGDYSWSNQASGTSAAVSNVAGEPNHPGIRRFATGTDTTGYAGLNNRLSFIDPTGGDNISLAVRFSANTGIIWRGGMVDFSTGADSTDGYYFEFDTTTSANWRIVTANNTTRTKTTTSTAVASNTWYKLTIVVNSANTSVEFFVNGVSVGTIATNLPAAGRTFGVAHIIQNDGTATTSVNADIDYVYWFNRNLTR